MKILFGMFIALLINSLPGNGQILKPVTWAFEGKKTSASEATIFITANLADGWHIYSQTLSMEGPVKTTFTFIPAKSFELKGNVEEPEPIVKFEKVFDLNVEYFERVVVFQQMILMHERKTTVKGKVEFMLCSDQKCLPPQTKEFSIPVSLK